MNNINARHGEHRTHKAVHHKINCQISSDLIAYYVMSVCANEYKKDNMLQYICNTQAAAIIRAPSNDYVVW